MGLFGIDSTKTTSTSVDSRTAASDQAVVAREGAQLGAVAGQSAGGAVTGSNLLSVGARQAQGSNVASEGSTLLQGNAKLDQNITNQNVDTAVIDAFGKSISDVIGNQGTSLRDI